jgi:hypothetical protein
MDYKKRRMPTVDFMKKNKNIKIFFSLLVKKITLLFLLVILSFIFYYISTGTTPSSINNKKIYKIIKTDFKDAYVLDIVEKNISGYGENSIIVFANDKNYQNQCAIDELKPFQIAVYEYNNSIFSRFSLFVSPVKKVYSFSYSDGDIYSNSEGKRYNNNFWIQKHEIVDLDGDGKNEIVVNILSSVCGSVAQKHILIFRQVGNEIELANSLPPISYPRDCPLDICNTQEGATKFISENTITMEYFSTSSVITNRFDGKKQEIFYASSDDYTDFTDLNSDGAYELVYAHPEVVYKKECFEVMDKCDGAEDYINCIQKNDPGQDVCECHWCPHYYVIGVYKMVNGDYAIDNNWNSGLLYKTEKKLDPLDVLGFKEVSGNIFGFIRQYYISDSLNIENDNNNFYLISGKKSVIKEIIEKNYK